MSNDGGFLPKGYQFEPVEPKGVDFVQNYQEDKVYIGDWGNGEGKYISEVVDSELTVHETTRTLVKAIYVVKKDKIVGLRIEKYKKKSGELVDDPETMILDFKQTSTLGDFCDFLMNADLKSVAGGHLTLETPLQLDSYTEKQLRTLLDSEEGKDLLEKVLNTGGVTSRDFVNLGRRKKQLEIFKKMLDDPEKLKKYKDHFEIKKAGEEPAWQHFFEQNTWIFGYSLNYVWCNELDDQQLEQCVSGFDFTQSGKIVDALMQTSGAINSFVLVEIKTPRTEIMGQSKSSEYRRECWVPSDEFQGGLSQIQVTTNRFREEILKKYQVKDQNGFSTNKYIYNINPRNYLIVGRLSEFMDGEAVHEGRFTSFELMRTDLKNTEIITFDELYARAKSIIEK